MRITEIIKEAAPASIPSKIGAAASKIWQQGAAASKIGAAAARTIGKGFLSGFTGQKIGSGKAAELDPGQEFDASGAMGQKVAKELGQQLSQQWISSITNLMTSKGAADFTLLDPADVENSLKLQVQDVVKNLTNGRETDYKNIPDYVNDTDGIAASAVSTVDNTMNQIKTTKPDKPNQTKLQGLFDKLARNLFMLSRQRLFNPKARGGGIRLDPRLEFTPPPPGSPATVANFKYDGNPLDLTNPTQLTAYNNFVRTNPGIGI